MTVFWAFLRRLSIKSRRFGTLCRFHLQQVMKCEWGQAGNCLYLYGKRVVEKSSPGQSEVRGGVGVVGVKKACGQGGGGEVCKSL
jgi:hypothetical protein